MNKKVLFVLPCLMLWASGLVMAQLNVTANNNATALAQALVGSGVNISNATFTGSAGQAGTFGNGNSANLGFNSGVVLSTGNVSDIPQAGTAFASTDYSGAGDATLNGISTSTTNDASVLQFDFTVQGNTLNFRYVFASEEYPEYVCSQFNDVFGFFISGPNPGGGNYSNSNIALIPNTSLSVAINAVNSGSPGGGYSSSGCTSLAYSQYYLDNQNGSSLVYDGYTTVLNANISVVPCQTYHLKLAIADVFDGVWDSGVFLEASSFVSQSSSVTAFFDPGFTSTFEGCVGGGFNITVPSLATSSTAINYTVTGTATNGVDYPTLSGTAYVNPGTSSALVYVDPLTDNQSEGPETVTITIYDPCTGLPEDSATITINDPPNDTAYASTPIACLGQQVQLTATGGGTYAWTPTTGLSDPNIANPVVTVNADVSYTANITFGTCSSNRTVNIQADSISAQIISTDATICPGSMDTLFASVDGGVSPFTFQWSPGGQVSDPVAQLVTTTPATTTNYSVVVTDDNGCTAADNYTLNVNTNLQISLGADVNVCPENSPYTLSVPGGPYDAYLWSNGDTTASISVSASGSYAVTVVAGLCTYTSDTVNVNFYTPVNPTLSGTGFCTGSQTTLQVAQGSYTNILWSTGDTTASIAVGVAGDYYYTANDSNGCFIHSDTATVVENQVPAVNASASPATICPGDSSTLTSGAPAGLSYQWSTNETTSSITVTAAGTYYLTVSNAVCASYDTVTVSEFPNPQPTVVADTTVCNGEPATFSLLNGQFLSYTWSDGTTGTTSITVTAAGSYNVTVNDGTCDWVSNDVQLNNFPTPVPTLSDTGACLGNDVTLSVENGLVNIIWNTQANTPTIVVSTNGTFYYTAEDVNGCPVVSDTATVTFQNPPSVNASAGQDTICPGSSTTISANATGSNLSYLWSPTGDTTATITVSQAGTYIVEVNDFFCPAFDTVQISQYQFPAVTLPDSNTVCAGTDITLTPSGGPYLTYNWSDGTTAASDTVILPGVYNVTVNNGVCDLVSNDYILNNYPNSHPHLADTGACLGNMIVLQALPGMIGVTWSTGSETDTIHVADNGIYFYTGDDQHECAIVSDTATVTFNPPVPVTIAAAPDTICEGGTSVLMANAQGSNLTYLWQPGGDTTASVTISQTVTYSVTVDDGSCPGSDTITIYQYQPLEVLLNNDTTVCPGSSVNIAPSGGPYTTYSWNNGASSSGISVNVPGGYWVTVNDGHCDYVSDTFQLTNYQLVQIHAYSDTDVCAGQPVVLTSDADLGNYGWSNNQSGPSITVTAPGNYSYTATDNHGCQLMSDTVAVTNRPYPAPQIVATPPVICSNQGQTTLNAGSQQGVNYTWQPGGDVSPTLQVTQAGTYTVAAELAGCVSYDTLTITVADSPVLNLDPFVLSCCMTVTLDPAPGRGYSYLWSDGSTDSTLTVTSTNNASAAYSVTATSTEGCTAVANTSVLIKCINAVANALPDTVMLGDSSQLSVVTDYNTDFSYNWTPSTGLNDATLQNPAASPTEETHYTVIVTDIQDECMDTAEVTVFVLYGDKIAMPNAFTPNGDGKNDVFYPVLLGDYQQVIEFRIYDRWGAMVHNSTAPWDGSFSGKGQPAGTYVYYIIVRVPDPQNPGTTKDIKLSGSFTLLR